MKWTRDLNGNFGDCHIDDMRGKMLDTGCWIQDAGYWKQDTGCKMLDAGSQMLYSGGR